MTARSWVRISLAVPAAAVDEACSLLGAGGLGVEIDDADGSCLLRAYFESQDAAERATASLQSVWGEPAVDAQADGRWVERYQQSLTALPLGGRFQVLPGPGFEAASGRQPIRLVPGGAFGTGEHPTTRLCAAALEDAVVSGSHWLDLGTGSGILAVVATGLGARRVLALDEDPAAVAVAREVVAANGFADRIELQIADTSSLDGLAMDGLVANVGAALFLRQAVPIVGAVRPGGVLIVSGFLESDAQEVGDALSAVGARRFAASGEDGWSCLRLQAGRP